MSFMPSVNRRDCLKVASVTALPGIAGQSTAFRSGEQQRDYVESETVLDEVSHFPHPDEGGIVRTNGKFLYVEIADDANPDPMNSWIEARGDKHAPLTYPRVLWLDDSIKHTIWAELVDDEKQFFVDHGMLFGIPPGSEEISLYVGGEKQSLDPQTQSELRRARSDFQVTNVSHEKMEDKTRLSMDVENRLDRTSTFRACLNVTSPLRYAKFIVDEISDEKTVRGDVFHGEGADPEDVEIELITAHTN